MGMDVDGFLRKMKEDKDVREREGGWVPEKNKGEGGCERERREEKEEKCWSNNLPISFSLLL